MADLAGGLAVELADICASRGWAFTTWYDYALSSASTPYGVAVFEEDGRETFRGRGADHEIPLRMAIDHLERRSPR